MYKQDTQASLWQALPDYKMFFSILFSSIYYHWCLFILSDLLPYRLYGCLIHTSQTWITMMLDRPKVREGMGHLAKRPLSFCVTDLTEEDSNQNPN